MHAAICFYSDEGQRKVSIIPVEDIQDFNEENCTNQPHYVKRYNHDKSQFHFSPAEVLAIGTEQELLNKPSRFRKTNLRYNDVLEKLKQKNTTNEVSKKNSQNMKAKKKIAQKKDGQKILKTFLSTRKQLTVNSEDEGDTNECTHTEIKKGTDMELSLTADPASESTIDLPAQVDDLNTTRRRNSLSGALQDACLGEASIHSPSLRNQNSACSAGKGDKVNGNERRHLPSSPFNSQEGELPVNLTPRRESPILLLNPEDELLSDASTPELPLHNTSSPSNAGQGNDLNGTPRRSRVNSPLNPEQDEVLYPPIPSPPLINQNQAPSSINQNQTPPSINQNQAPLSINQNQAPPSINQNQARNAGNETPHIQRDPRYRKQTLYTAKLRVLQRQDEDDENNVGDFDNTLQPGTRVVNIPENTPLYEINGDEIYIGCNTVIQTAFWEYIKHRGSTIFLRELCEIFWGKNDLVNRCFKKSKTTTALLNRSPRKTFTPRKYNNLKRLFIDYLNETFGNCSKKKTILKNMNRIIGYKIRDVRQLNYEKVED